MSYDVSEKAIHIALNMAPNPVTHTDGLVVVPDVLTNMTTITVSRDFRIASSLQWAAKASVVVDNGLHRTLSRITLRPIQRYPTNQYKTAYVRQRLPSLKTMALTF